MSQNISKSLPEVAYPDNWDAFNGNAARPLPVSRNEAAAMLRRARLFQATKQAIVRKEGAHSYRLSGISTVIMNTRPVPTAVTKSQFQSVKPKRSMHP